MRLRVLSVVMCWSACAAGFGEQTWTSDDGLISVAVPDSGRFTRLDPPPAPLVACWVSKDETTKLAVMTMPIPPGVGLRQRSLEEGLLEEISGELVESSTDEISGRPSYRMTARAGDQVTYLAQSVVAVDASVYKVMAVTAGGPPENDDDAKKFLASLKVVGPADGPKQSVGSPEPDPRALAPVGLDTHELSKKLGGIGLITLLACLAVIWHRKRHGRVSGKASAPPLAPTPRAGEGTTGKS